MLAVFFWHVEKRLYILINVYIASALAFSFKGKLYRHDVLYVIKAHSSAASTMAVRFVRPSPIFFKENITKYKESSICVLCFFFVKWPACCEMRNCLGNLRRYKLLSYTL